MQLGILLHDTKVDDFSPYISKAGGKPGFYKNICFNEQQDEIICPNCNDYMFLVTQIYAPINNINRTLYIYGCNRLICSTLQNSWKAFRYQEKVEKLDEPEKEINITYNNKIENKDSQINKFLDDPLNDNINGKKIKENENDKSFDDDINNNDVNIDIQLESLLSNLNINTFNKKANTNTKKKRKKNIKISNISTNSNERKYFPSIYMDFIDELSNEENENNNFTYEEKLLNKYLLDEEINSKNDQTLINEIKVLKEYLKNKTNKKETEKEQNLINKYDKIVNSVVSSGEKYEKMPQLEKMFFNFQNKIKENPSQCIRYGDKPLWPLPKPKDFSIGPCICGEKRIFELQLIPTLNYLLQVDQYSIETNNNNKKMTENKSSSNVNLNVNKVLNENENDNDNENEMEKEVLFKKGMDWLTVMLWSCPVSCDKSYKEFLYIISPFN